MPVDPEDLTIETLRAVSVKDRRRNDPPPDLFGAIEAEVFGRGGPAGSTRAGPRPGQSPSGVTDLAAHRRRRNSRMDNRTRNLVVLGAVAAAAVLIAGVVTTLSNQVPDQEVVASADMELLAGAGSASAELVDRDDGTYLVVDVANLSPEESADFYELWLLAPDVSEMASVARFSQDSTTVEVRLPGDVDPNVLPVVDISSELDDGDDTHSGASILRGTLA